MNCYKAQGRSQFWFSYVMYQQDSIGSFRVVGNSEVILSPDKSRNRTCPVSAFIFQVDCFRVGRFARNLL